MLNLKNSFLLIFNKIRFDHLHLNKTAPKQNILNFLDIILFIAQFLSTIFLNI